VVTIREIVEATGLAKTTVIRLIQTLEQSGLLWATTSGYMAGPGLWRWAHLARSSWELPPETQAHDARPGRAQRETVNVYVAADIGRVCIAQQESPQPLRHVGARRRRAADVGRRRRPRCCCATPRPGAARPASRRSSPYGEQARPPAAGSGSTRPPTRASRSATAEREEGLTAVAVPVLGPRPAPWSPRSPLSGPTMRFTDERIRHLPSRHMTEVDYRMPSAAFDHPLGSSF
jgi:DNA-binding IclR family transcriptional regulator